MGYDYKVEIDRPADKTLCDCSDCAWQGYFSALQGIEDCSLTPGDPSPAGRCPECDSLAYVTEECPLLVVRGSISEGYQFYGPFKDQAAVNQFIDRLGFSVDSCEVKVLDIPTH